MPSSGTPLEAFGLRPIFIKNPQSSLPLRVGIGALEWVAPTTYRAVAFGSDTRTARYSYPLQSLLFDAAAWSGTLLLANFLQVPDLTHNPQLHVAQNILTFYGEKGLVNTATLYADWEVRRGRVRNDLRRH